MVSSAMRSYLLVVNFLFFGVRFGFLTCVVYRPSNILQFKTDWGMGAFRVLELMAQGSANMMDRLCNE